MSMPPFSAGNHNTNVPLTVVRNSMDIERGFGIDMFDAGRFSIKSADSRWSAADDARPATEESYTPYNISPSEYTAGNPVG
jgi:hypothetical protein